MYGRALALTGLTIALSAPSALATGGGTVTWNGQRGLDSVGTCAAGETPYLHWVLTPGGKAKIATAGTTLTVDGETVNGQREGNGAGALHFYTSHHDPATITSAVASFSGTAGRNSLLTISSGCSGPALPPPPPDDPNPLPCDVSASATGTAGVTTNVHEVGATSGVVTLHAFAYSVPDRFQVIYQGDVLLDQAIGTAASPGVLGAPSVDPVNDKVYTVPFSGASSQVTVQVTGDAGTVWDYQISCAAPPA